MSTRLPNGWSAYDFDEIATISSGQVDPKSSEYSDLPIVGSENLPSGGGALVGTIRTAKVAGVISGKYLFEREQVIYSKIRPNLNKVWLSTFSGLCSADIYPISFDPEKLLPPYAYAYVLSDRFLRSAVSASMRSGIPKVNREDLSSIVVKVPSLDEQRRIVAILDSTQRAASISDLIADRLLSLHKKRMEEIFSHDSVRTRAWASRSLGDLGYIATGGTPSSHRPEYWNGGVAWITPAEVTGLPTRFIHSSERTISELGLQNCAADVLPPLSLIVCTRATVGDACINTVAMAINQGFKAIVPNKDVDVDFLYFLIQSLRSQLVRLANGSTFLEIGKRDFESIEVKVPKLKQQKAIARLLVAELERIEAYRLQAGLFLAQKRGLMQKLLSGEWRLTRDLPGMDSSHV